MEKRAAFKEDIYNNCYNLSTYKHGRGYIFIP